MGSPPGEPERHPDEDQVEVTLTKGFWMGKYEVTQGQWKAVMGKLPGELTAELPEGNGFPVGNVNFAEAEEFCRKIYIRQRPPLRNANTAAPLVYAGVAAGPTMAGLAAQPFDCASSPSGVMTILDFE
jgi:hypothetical protein